MSFSNNQKKREETNQRLAYDGPRGNSWEHTVHEIFDKLPAISPEIFLQLKISHFFKNW